MARDEEARRGGSYPEVARAALEEVSQEIADRWPGVQAVFLFGSRATGKVRPSSDIDLAILLEDPDVGLDQYLMQEEMAELVETRVGVPADVVLLHPDLSPGLLFDIFRVETILFCREYERAHRVACQARAEYRDLLPRLERISEATLRYFRKEDHATHGA